MRWFVWLALAAWVLVTPATFGATTRFSKIDVKGSEVNGNVYLLQADLGSGNIGASVGPDGILHC